MSENNENNDPQLGTSAVMKADNGEQLIPSPPHENLEPVPSSERLGVMDSLRGIALIGILMMNIEWFNRPTSELGRFDSSLNGYDYGASFFVKLFVEGKFYKLFALLFGMGFAVMLIKAQQSGRPFASMFVRRMSALFIFGMAHYIFIWDGDILHDYAFAGLLLLGWVQLTKTKFFSRFSKPRSFLRFGLSVLCLPVVIGIGMGTWHGLTNDNNELAEQWSERQEAVVLSKKLIAEGALEKEDEEEETSSDESSVNSETEEVASSSDKQNGIESSADDLEASAEDSTVAKTEGDETEAGDAKKEEPKDVDEMTREERIEHFADRIIKSKKRRQKSAEEEITAVTGSYSDGVAFRAESAPGAMGQTIGFSLMMLFPIFMIGYWLVASGVLNNPKKHGAIFKSLAIVGLLVGLGTTLIALTIMQYPPTMDIRMLRNNAGGMFQFSQYVVAAGYLGAMVWMYQTNFMRKVLDIFAPIGRMALTNYIMHSLILGFIFYGYGQSMFGQILRADQMLIVAAIIFGQLIISTLWLKAFRFGPLEWLWRCLTYKKLQPMKRSKTLNGEAAVV